FRLPTGRTDAHDTKLCAAAQMMADAAESFAATFIGAGLPLDFIAQLRQAGAELAESVATCQSLRAKRIAAGRAIPAALAQGRTAVRVLDALVAPRFDAAGSLPTWKRATTVRRPSRHRTITSPSLANTHE
ncbi:MAG TPA: hypothetical protein VMH39_05985, partial [Gemmatimonadaceae bacterium]|nr:hypothetical protein [Gemmatimonadaceae bacterium]